MSETSTLRVHMNRKPVGFISLLNEPPAAGGQELGLTYFLDWIANGFAVSPHLQTEIPVPSRTTVRNFISNLLPEGTWLEDLSARAGCSKHDVFGLIAAIGEETAGALSFSVVSENDSATSFREIPKDELAERIAARKTVPISVWDQKPRMSVAGVQEKLPVLIRPDGAIGFGEGDLASTHLLKFGKDPELHLVINEFLCMRLANAVGLPVADVTLERFGEPVLSVRRFDRQWRDDRVDRLHLIDGCQILDLPPTFKYERPFGRGGHVSQMRTGASLPSLFSACRDYCAVPAAAMKQFLDWALFQLIIGNSDAHGKNISFFVNERGISLAPAYDLLSLDLYDYDRELAMAVGDCFNPDEVASFPLAEMCEECRLPQRATANVLSLLCNKTLKALKTLAFPWLSKEEEEFANILMARIAANAERLQLVARDLPKVRL